MFQEHLLERIQKLIMIINNKILDITKTTIWCSDRSKKNIGIIIR